MFAILGARAMVTDRNVEAVRRLVNFLAVLGILFVVVGLPARFYQVERFVAPFAKASAYLSELNVDVVLVDIVDIYTGINLVRNSPFLTNVPKIVSLDHLSDEELAMVCEKYTIALVDRVTLRRFGLPEIRFMTRAGAGDFDWQRRRRERAGCAE